MKVTKYSALLALLMTSGLVHAQTPVNQQITAPTWNAANSTDTYAETVASLNATGLTPAEIAANAVNDAFAAAVTTLNEDDTTPGSAAFYRAARIALDADPTNIVRQAELARAQTLYSTNLTTVTNLEAAAEVEGVSINTFSGASGQDVIGIDLDDSEGAAAVALAAAQEASNAIEGILDYYGEGAGATTTEESFADLEGEVIDPLRDLVASNPGDDLNNDGFVDLEALAVTTAAGNLATAEADYQTVASDPTSTQAQIATAAGALAGAQTAFATSVVKLYENFSPITAPTKDALLGSVLNGSWERDAIKSSAEGLAQEVEDRAALIRTEGDNADGNPIIHIGENSLVTQELGGEQLLSATDGVDDIDIRISGDTNLIVDNDLTVTGETSTTGITNTGNTTLGDALTDTTTISGNATVGGTLGVTGATTTGSLGVTNGATVGTTLGVTGATTTGSLGVNNGATVGGTLGVNGNTTLGDALTDTTTISGNASVGQDLTVARNATVTGTSALTGATTVGGGNAIAGQALTVNGATTTTGNSSVGGNSTVTGNSTVNGNTILGDNVADTTTISGNASVGQDLTVARNTTVNGTLTAGATTTDGITNDGNIATTTLGVTGAATVGTSGTNPDGVELTVHGNARIINTLEVGGINNSGQRITNLADGIDRMDAATFGQMQDADTIERNARIAGDSRLQSNIDENTRGIAMVAAMTNTTVDIGKTHAVDFNMAQFQSETGFAFGYANRINENVQVHTSVASTTDFDESVVRLGVAVQW